MRALKRLTGVVRFLKNAFCGMKISGCLDIGEKILLVVKMRTVIIAIYLKLLEKSKFFKKKKNNLKNFHITPLLPLSYLEHHAKSGLKKG